MAIISSSVATGLRINRREIFIGAWVFVYEAASAAAALAPEASLEARL
jgi:hypothetical protein